MKTYNENDLLDIELGRHRDDADEQRRVLLQMAREYVSMCDDEDGLREAEEELREAEEELREAYQRISYLESGAYDG